MDMVKRGDLYYADLSPVVGSEQGGVRPVLIVQNNVGNKYSPTIIAAAVTTVAITWPKSPRYFSDIGNTTFCATSNSASKITE